MCEDRVRYFLYISSPWKRADTNELIGWIDCDRPIRLLPSSEKQHETESDDITYNVTMAKEDDSNRDECCGSDGRER